MKNMETHRGYSAIEKTMSDARVTRGQGRVQNGAAIIGRFQTAGILKAIHFGVQYRAAPLHTPVVSPAHNPAVDDENRADGNAALAQSCFRFVDCRFEELI